MSNGNSTFHRWITRSRFRDCSTRRSCSKACLCPYTRRMIANHAEQTSVTFLEETAPVKLTL
jgi:hypothetical protein